MDKLTPRGKPCGGADATKALLDVVVVNVIRRAQQRECGQDRSDVACLVETCEVCEEISQIVG